MATTSNGSTPSIEELHATRQSRIGMLQEFTQTFVAFAITLSYVYIAAYRATSPPEGLNSAFFVIVGFYFAKAVMSNNNNNK